VEQLPGNLKGDEGLARAGGQRQQDAILPACDGFQHPLDGDVLIIAALEIAASVLEGDHGKTVAPRIRFGKREIPQFVRRREAGHFASVPSCMSMP